MAFRLLPAGSQVLPDPGVDCKPGSVPLTLLHVSSKDHSSRPAVTRGLEHSDPDTAAPPRRRGRVVRAGHSRRYPYLSLLREGFTSPPVTRLSRVGSYPTFSPLPPRSRGAEVGRVFSVALSLGSPPVAVSHLPALWSPDFPPPARMCRRRSSVHLRQAQSKPRMQPNQRVPGVCWGRRRPEVHACDAHCGSESLACC